MNPTAKPRRRGRLAGALAGFLLGVLAGVFFHYLAYRYSLPSRPFIYVAF
jgi:hypothetical protein